MKTANSFRQRSSESSTTEFLSRVHDCVDSTTTHRFPLSCHEIVPRYKSDTTTTGRTTDTDQIDCSIKSDISSSLRCNRFCYSSVTTARHRQTTGTLKINHYFFPLFSLFFFLFDDNLGIAMIVH